MDRALPDAIALAALAHSGALDKSGHPYITHPIRVMLRCQEHGERVQMAAVLHDVVEDTWVTLDLLRAIGYPHEVVEAVDALTRRTSEESYFEYIARCSRNAMALQIKLADIEDNSDPRRRFGDHYDDLMEKYRQAREVLLAALNGHCNDSTRVG
jgi:(p)ppGpp synthase/HD superfamily hydrolase